MQIAAAGYGFGMLVSISLSAAAVVHPLKGGHAFLGTNTSQLNCKKKTTKPAGHGYGKDKCPCVGIDNLKGYFATQIEFHHIQYPLEVGASCSTWDETFHPQCKETPMPTWCLQSWCYVDPCECDIDVLPKKTTTGRKYQGHPAFWSYNTCGALDFYTATIAPDACVHQKDYNSCLANPDCGWDGKQCGGKEAMATCDAKSRMDTSTYGRDDCRCVGFHGHKNGRSVMYINDHEQVSYDVNAGATCGAWEKSVHPDCLKPGPKPSFCDQRWCFVDPCKCSGGAPPRTVMEANGDLRFQGKTVYWSYDTCGSTDQWSGTMKSSYCVTQTTEAGCNKLEKCTWTEKGCIGRALAEICVEQKSTGILGIEVLKSNVVAAKPCVTIAAIAVALLALL